MFAQLIDGGFSVLEGIFGVWGVCNMVCVVLFVLLWKQMGGHVLMTDWHTTYMDLHFRCINRAGHMNLQPLSIPRSKIQVQSWNKQKAIETATPIQPAFIIGIPPLLIILSFYRQRVSEALQKAQATTILHQPVVAGGEREREASSKLLVSFEVFLSSPYRTCFMLLMMGLGPRFCVFSS